ncbi:MAG: dihydroneopterin aldolase family protein [Candidatus Thermoplasmatota archaeon]|nr:dihydroneopterin aldolase family protein [Candidatus Thermoplasmatota archaeon]
MESKRYFNCSDRDRAVFEAGIKLASIYHQFIGAPVNQDSVDHFEKAIERGMMAQPYVKDAKVAIDRHVLMTSLSPYGYCSLNERMLKAVVTVVYEGIEVKASMGWIEDLRYPLMRIDRVSEREDQDRKE